MYEPVTRGLLRTIIGRSSDLSIHTLLHLPGTYPQWLSQPIKLWKNGSSLTATSSRRTCTCFPFHPTGHSHFDHENTSAFPVDLWSISCRNKTFLTDRLTCLLDTYHVFYIFLCKAMVAQFIPKCKEHSLNGKAYDFSMGIHFCQSDTGDIALEYHKLPL